MQTDSYIHIKKKKKNTPQDKQIKAAYKSFVLFNFIARDTRVSNQELLSVLREKQANNLSQPLKIKATLK